MKIEDFNNVLKHINILNVAYHLNLEIIRKNGNEVRAICPFCGYKDNKRNANLVLYHTTNKYHCFNCGVNGYSIGLYGKLKCINTKKAFKELIEREVFSIDKTQTEIIPTNEIADVNYRNKVYLEFLNMLKLNPKHKNFLLNSGFTDNSIKVCNFKSIPTKRILRQLICSKLKIKYNLEGIPGFYMHEDFKWDFVSPLGFLIPVYDEWNRIQGLTVYLDKEFNECRYLWFSSNNRLNGTAAQNWLTKANIREDTKTVILTDNLLTYNIIKEKSNKPIIAFSGITNAYHILKELENTNVENIIFTIRKLKDNQKLDYMIEKIFKNLLIEGYNITYKYIKDYKDILKENFLISMQLKAS